MTILYGTTNPAKLLSMRKRLSKLNIDIICLKDLNKPIPEFPEKGNTPLENAREKAYTYYKAFGMPVFS